MDRILIFNSTINYCFLQLGDIFTIHAAGKMMTFVTDHRNYQHYFTTTHADFQAAVQPFTKGAGMYAC